jgi:hypothetical protein
MSNKKIGLFVISFDLIFAPKLSADAVDRICEQRARQAHIELKNNIVNGHTPAGPALISPTK